MHQTQSRLNQTSYRNFHFSEFVANALHDNMTRQKNPASNLRKNVKMPPHLEFSDLKKTKILMGGCFLDP